MVEMTAPRQEEDERHGKRKVTATTYFGGIIQERDLLRGAPQQALEELQAAYEGGHVQTAQGRAILQSSKASFTLQVGAALLPIIVGRLIRGATQSVAVLQASSLVQKALYEMGEKKEKDHPSDITQQKTPVFPTSGSMGLDILTRDPSKLPSEVPRMQNEYPHCALKAPNLVEVRNVRRTSRFYSNI